LYKGTHNLWGLGFGRAFNKNMAAQPGKTKKGEAKSITL